MWKYIKRYLSLAIIAGLFMVGEVLMDLVLFGGSCGSMNNAFVHLSSQNIGSEMRKDAFRHSMAFSFSQSDLLCCAFSPLSLE